MSPHESSPRVVALADARRYRMGALIGRGAMGEVHRAFDTSLERDVAVKALPTDLTADSRRVGRLLREARLLASLSHPHIAVVHDLIEREGRPLLVMELVEGETLAERLAAGRLPLAEALSIAIQVADALQAAHAQGVAHCDLKPANIKLRPDGHVKVLDFGLVYKLRDEDLSDSGSTASLESTDHLRGTPAYISPEQLDGHHPDAQTDIWAFGCVLFELITMRRAFGRGGASETLRAIRDETPDWSLLPATTPRTVRAVVHRCLQKDRRARLRDAADAGSLLEEAQLALRDPPARLRTRVPMWLAHASWLALGAAVGVGSWALWPSSTREAPPMRRLLVPVPANAEQPVVSPDGRRVAFTFGQRLWVLDLDSTAPRALTDEEARIGRPFWSPDSKALAFFAQHTLMVVRLEGGRQQVAPLPQGAPNSGHWARDGTIYVADGPTLFSVPATGGTLTMRYRVDPTRYAILGHPYVLPDGRRILITLTELSDDHVIAAIDGDRLRIVHKVERQPSMVPHYVDSGWLVFLRGADAARCLRGPGLESRQPASHRRADIDSRQRPHTVGEHRWRCSRTARRRADAHAEVGRPHRSGARRHRRSSARHPASGHRAGWPSGCGFLEQERRHTGLGA